MWLVRIVMLSSCCRFEDFFVFMSHCSVVFLNCRLLYYDVVVCLFVISTYRFEVIVVSCWCHFKLTLSWHFCCFSLFFHFEVKLLFHVVICCILLIPSFVMSKPFYFHFYSFFSSWVGVVLLLVSNFQLINVFQLILST